MDVAARRCSIAVYDVCGELLMANCLSGHPKHAGLTLGGRDNGRNRASQLNHAAALREYGDMSGVLVGDVHWGR